MSTAEAQRAKLKRMYPRVDVAPVKPFDYGHACGLAWQRGDRRHAIRHRGPVSPLSEFLLLDAARKAILMSMYPFRQHTP